MSQRELLLLLSWLTMLAINIGLKWTIKDLQEIIEGQDSVVKLQWNLIESYKAVIGKYIREYDEGKL